MSVRLRPPSQLKTLLNSSARPMAGESGAPIRAAGTERQHCSAFNNGEPTVVSSAADNGFVVSDAVERNKERSCRAKVAYLSG